MTNIIWLIPFLPLAGFLLNGIFGKSMGKNLAGIVGSGSILGSFLISCMLFFQLAGGAEKSFEIDYFSWFQAGNFSASFSFLIDPLSSVMLLVITGVGFLIHVYSIGYMHDDEAFHRFFSYMNLFVFFMLLLVLGNNYALMFTGWEGVGLCSYLLIGFWFKNTGYNNAAKKAFIMNRIGDLAFVLGIFLIYNTFGSITYKNVFEASSGFSSDSTVLISITLLLFIGAIGKSAQIPLYTWLPDAMAGPTPVSALIHAATMVTAGIYMIARSNILYTLAPVTLSIVGAIGIATALFAATIGLAQNDIKKVLAYSTVSQLGYMFAALGAGAYTSGIFHLVTHAFFKALLFLAAGSVIHALHGEQDIRKMGGLKKKLPVTYSVFLIATLAISGIPPFSGFFSKDEILLHLYEHNILFWLAGIAGSALTTFYMFRLLYLTFFGKFRGTVEQENHLHESPKIILIPLIILAVLSATGGFIGIPEFTGMNHLLGNFLHPVFAESMNKIYPAEISHSTEYLLMGIAVSVALISIFVAGRMYLQKSILPAPEGQKLSPLHELVYRKYFIDELYERIIVMPLRFISQHILTIVEENLITRGVDSFGWTTIKGSRLLKNLQAGYTGFYIFAMVVSILLILLFNLF